MYLASRQGGSGLEIGALIIKINRADVRSQATQSFHLVLNVYLEPSFEIGRLL